MGNVRLGDFIPYNPEGRDKIANKRLQKANDLLLKCFVEAYMSNFDLLQLSSAQLLNIKMLMNKDLGAD